MKENQTQTKGTVLTLLTAGAIWLVAGAMWVSLGVGVAHAGGVDEKLYPATMCRPGDPYTKNFGVSKGMHIFNKSSFKYLVVFCPIIRDYTENSAKLEWVEIQFRNPYHADPTRRVDCAAEIRLLHTSGLFQSQYALGSVTSPLGSGKIHIPIPSSDSNVNLGTYYQAVCYLPPNDGQDPIMLLDYRVRENGKD